MSKIRTTALQTFQTFLQEESIETTCNALGILESTFWRRLSDAVEELPFSQIPPKFWSLSICPELQVHVQTLFNEQRADIGDSLTDFLERVKTCGKITVTDETKLFGMLRLARQLCIRQRWNQSK